jgi:hypothetical protein
VASVEWTPLSAAHAIRCAVVTLAFQARRARKAPACAQAVHQMCAAGEYQMLISGNCDGVHLKKVNFTARRSHIFFNPLIGKYKS